VIAGDFQGTTGPAQTFSPIHLWDMQLTPGTTLPLPVPTGHTTALVVRNGNINVNGSQTVAGATLVLFDPKGDHISLEAETPAGALLLSGQPLNEPVVGQGPFVMNTHEEIRQAYAEYQSGTMGHL
jgi:redox-sensitive bicupin YhaK (pirin superfamily)